MAALDPHPDSRPARIAYLSQEDVMPADRAPTPLAVHKHEAVSPVLPVRSDSLWRLPTVMDRVGMRRTTIYALIKVRKFPSPVKIGRASRWVDEEISQWILDRKLERNVPK
jgi:prophage regulatory protein